MGGRRGVGGGGLDCFLELSLTSDFEIYQIQIEYDCFSIFFSLLNQYHAIAYKV